MGETIFNDINANNGAETFLGLLSASNLIEYIFANTGTDHGPIVEALAKSERSNQHLPKTITVPHEHVAVSMAHGFYNISGKPQAALVHTLPGTANTVGAIMNACSSNVPLVLVAGRTPITEGEVHGGRSRPIHWRQESRDQGAMVREFVKWDYEIRSTKNMHVVIPRAIKIAMTEPRGPVYLTLPREWLIEATQPITVDLNSYLPATKFQAATSALEQAADLLVESERPLIITKYIGRNPTAVDDLVELAELLAIPVVKSRAPTTMNFPRDHKLYLGTRARKFGMESDVVFLIDIDVPWPDTSMDGFSPHVKFVQLEMDPTFSSIPLWGFHIDLPIAGCSEISLKILTGILKEKISNNSKLLQIISERRKTIEKKSEAVRIDRSKLIEETKIETPMNPLWVSKCISDLIDDDTIVFDESTTSPLHEVIHLTHANTYFGNPPAGHLGFGVGAALGAKLATPEKTVIAVVGDGAYMFAIPTACHFTAQKHHIPILVVILNNQAWNASINTVKEFYPEGVATADHNYPGCQLTPSPDFENIAQSCGAHAERVEDADQLIPAIEKALNVVRNEGRQALLNIICQPPT